MTMRKQRKQETKGASPTPAASLAAPQTAHSMSYWLERINPDVTERLWTLLMEFAKDVPDLTTSEIAESGTTSTVARRVAAIARITPDGCALTFTVSDTSKSAGGNDGV
jgi:hypothetical protein